jgi:demethylmenaquinone methyltransferase/2-methoxy-6-polyprenyl-1,4-benzoquinol methylase
MGQIVAGDRDSYQYLVESIRKFPDQDSFVGMIRAAGFDQVKYRNLSLGIAALHSGWKV